MKKRDFYNRFKLEQIDEKFMINLSIYYKLRNRVYAIILFVIIAIYSAGWSSLSISRHQIFATHTDTGGYEQIIWNTIHGDILRSTLHSSVAPFNSVRGGLVDLPTEIVPHIFSSLHMNIVLFLFAPIYAAFPYTETLLISQSIILASGAIPVYFIAKNELGNKPISIIISASYLIYPALHGANIIDYNYLVFAVPFLLSAFYFFRKENYKLYWIFIGLSLIVREDVSLFVLFLGIFLFAFQKKHKIGFITMAIGLSWFILTFFIIFPSLTGQTHFGGYFNSIGKGEGLFGIIKTLVTDPTLIYNRIVTVKEGYYLFQIFSHTAFLSFLSPSSFLMSLPNLLQNMLADFDSLRLMWAHYQLLIIPGVFVSTIFSIKKILNKLQSKRTILLISIGVTLLFFGIISNAVFSPAPIKDLGILISKDKITWEPRPVAWEFINIVCCKISGPIVIQSLNYEQLKSANTAIFMIPDNASVSSQDNFVSHLSKRKELYLFPLYYDKVDYVLVMEKTQGIFDTGYVPQEMQDKYISFLQNDRKHELIFNENGLLLFKKIK